MKDFTYKAQVIWAQVDANQHMRHSAYADFAAQARIDLLQKMGMSLKKFQKWNLGPILLREELKYIREVHLNDILTVTCTLLTSRKDASRWTIKHEFFRSDGVKAAVVEVEGAWMDLEKRKMTPLTGDVLELFLKAPKDEMFSFE